MTYGGRHSAKPNDLSPRGSGPYASWLAARGYMVHRIEPTSSHLEQAATRSRAGPDFQVSLGHAGALPLSEATQDAVLMLGPLYHLRDPGDRQRAWAEARRVLVEGGIVLAVAINQYAGLLDSLRAEYVDTGFGS